MRKSLLAAAVSLAALAGNAQEKPRVHLVIQAQPQQIRKAATTTFLRNGYSVDSESASQLKVSRPFTTDETNSYNTAHWTNLPVANCRHQDTFRFSPADGGTNVDMDSLMVCRSDGFSMLRHDEGIQSMQATLGDLKAMVERR